MQESIRDSRACMLVISSVLILHSLFGVSLSELRDPALMKYYDMKDAVDDIKHVDVMYVRTSTT